MTIRMMKKMISCLITVVLLFEPVGVYAQSLGGLPLFSSWQAQYAPIPTVEPTLKGITFFPDQPLRFDFLVSDHPDLEPDNNQHQAQKLIKYFFASLTTPDEEMWVNLNPAEPDRIVAERLGQTQMGRDMVAQDYMLKQLTASLLHPDGEEGQRFWNEVYAKVFEQYGTTEVPQDSFHRVWIVPEDAAVYRHDNSVFVVEKRLRVMLEEDYVVRRGGSETLPRSEGGLEIRHYETDLMRSIIIPAIEKEVNEGAHFANLRQIYDAMILATWYKRNLKQSVLNQVYANRRYGQGLEHIDTEQTPDKIWKDYYQSVQEGIYNFIKEEYDPHAQQEIPRQYFSGGLTNLNGDVAMITSPRQLSREQRQGLHTPTNNISVALQKPTDGAMTASEDRQAVFHQYIAQIRALNERMELSDPSFDRRLEKALQRSINYNDEHDEDIKLFFDGDVLMGYVLYKVRPRQAEMYFSHLIIDPRYMEQRESLVERMFMLVQRYNQDRLVYQASARDLQSRGFYSNRIKSVLSQWVGGYERRETQSGPEFIYTLPARQRDKRWRTRLSGVVYRSGMANKFFPQRYYRQEVFDFIDSKRYFPHADKVKEIVRQLSPEALNVLRSMIHLQQKNERQGFFGYRVAMDEAEVEVLMREWIRLSHDRFYWGQLMHPVGDLHIRATLLSSVLNHFPESSAIIESQLPHMFNENYARTQDISGEEDAQPIFERDYVSFGNVSFPEGSHAHPRLRQVMDQNPQMLWMLHDNFEISGMTLFDIEVLIKQRDKRLRMGYPAIKRSLTMMDVPFNPSLPELFLDHRASAKQRAEVWFQERSLAFNRAERLRPHIFFQVSLRKQPISKSTEDINGSIKSSRRDYNKSFQDMNVVVKLLAKTIEATNGIVFIGQDDTVHDEMLTYIRGALSKRYVEGADFFILPKVFHRQASEEQKYMMASMDVIFSTEGANPHLGAAYNIPSLVLYDPNILVQENWDFWRADWRGDAQFRDVRLMNRGVFHEDDDAGVFGAHWFGSDGANLFDGITAQEQTTALSGLRDLLRLNGWRNRLPAAEAVEETVMGDRVMTTTQVAQDQAAVVFEERQAVFSGAPTMQMPETWTPRLRFVNYAVPWWQRMVGVKGLVPAEMAMVEVVEEGLAFIETGKIIYRDPVLASKLSRLGISILGGMALQSKRFVKELADQSEEDMTLFLKQEGVYSVSVPENPYPIHESRNINTEADRQNRVSTVFDELEKEFPRTFAKLMPIFWEYHSYEDVNHNDPLLVFFRTLRRKGFRHNPHQSFMGWVVMAQIVEKLRYIQENHEDGYEMAVAIMAEFDIEDAYYRSIEVYLYVLEMLTAFYDQMTDKNVGVKQIFLRGFSGLLNGKGIWNIYDHENWADRVNRAFRILNQNIQGLDVWDVLMASSLVWDGRPHDVLNMRPLLDKLQGGEALGKQPIFRMELSSDGASQVVLVKTAEVNNARYDLIATEVSGILEAPHYHVDFTALGEYGVGENNVLEVIEFVPHDLIAGSDERRLGSWAVFNMSVLVPEDARPAELEERMVDLGRVFFLEYLLQAKDSKMKHILMGEDGRIYRIDWEHLFGDLPNEGDMIRNLEESDYGHFLKELRKRPDADAYFTAIKRGFNEAFALAQERQERIVEVIESNAPEANRKNAVAIVRANLRRSADEVYQEVVDKAMVTESQAQIDPTMVVAEQEELSQAVPVFEERRAAIRDVPDMKKPKAWAPQWRFITPTVDERWYHRWFPSLFPRPQPVVPSNMAIVRVVEEGLAFVETGEVVYRDAQLAQKLQALDVPLLGGVALRSRQFLNELSEQKIDDIETFMKQEGVYTLPEPKTRDHVDVSDNKNWETYQNYKTHVFGKQMLEDYPQAIDLLDNFYLELEEYFPNINIMNIRSLILEAWQKSTNTSDGWFMSFVMMGQVVKKARYFIDNHEQGRELAKHILQDNLFYWPFDESKDYMIDMLIVLLDQVKEKSFEEKKILRSLMWEALSSQYKPLNRESVEEIKRFFPNLDVFEATQVTHPWSILTGKTLFFDNKEWRVLDVTRISQEVTGKAVTLVVNIESMEGEPKTVLAKFSYSDEERKKDTPARHDFIGRAVSNILGLQTYHLESIDVDENNLWQIIEFVPHDLIASSPGKNFQLKNMEKLIDEGETYEFGLEQRMRDLGAILFVDYLLQTKDSNMKHILLAKNGRLFRIDWEYMLGVATSADVDRSDYEKFLNELNRQPDSARYFELIEQGFREAYILAQQKRADILAVIERNAPEDHRQQARDRVSVNFDRPVERVYDLVVKNKLTQDQKLLRGITLDDVELSLYNPDDLSWIERKKDVGVVNVNYFYERGYILHDIAGVNFLFMLNSHPENSDPNNVMIDVFDITDGTLTPVGFADFQGVTTEYGLAYKKANEQNFQQMKVRPEFELRLNIFSVEVPTEDFSSLRTTAGEDALFVKEEYRNGKSKGVWGLDKIMIDLLVETVFEKGIQKIDIIPSGEREAYYRRIFEMGSNNSITKETKRTERYTRVVRYGDGRARFILVEQGEEDGAMVASSWQGRLQENKRAVLAAGVALIAAVVTWLNWSDAEKEVESVQPVAEQIDQEEEQQPRIDTETKDVPNLDYDQRTLTFIDYFYTKSQLTFLQGLTDQIQTQDDVKNLVNNIDDPANQELIQNIRDAIQQKTLLNLSLATVKFIISDFNYFRGEFSIMYGRFRDPKDAQEIIVRLDKYPLTELGNHMFDRESLRYALILVQASRLHYDDLRVGDLISQVDNILGYGSLLQGLRDWQERHDDAYYIALLPQLLNINEEEEVEYQQNNVTFVVNALSKIFSHDEIIDMLANVALRELPYRSVTGQTEKFLQSVAAFVSNSEFTENINERIAQVSRVLNRSVKSDLINDPGPAFEVLVMMNDPDMPELKLEYIEQYWMPALSQAGVELSLTGWFYLLAATAEMELDFADEKTAAVFAGAMGAFENGFNEYDYSHWGQLVAIMEGVLGKEGQGFGEDLPWIVDLIATMTRDFGRDLEEEYRGAVRQYLRARYKVETYAGADTDAEYQRLAVEESAALLLMRNRRYGSNLILPNMLFQEEVLGDPEQNPVTEALKYSDSPEVQDVVEEMWNDPEVMSLIEELIEGDGAMVVEGDNARTWQERLRKNKNSFLAAGVALIAAVVTWLNLSDQEKEEVRQAQPIVDEQVEEVYGTASASRDVEQVDDDQLLLDPERRTVQFIEFFYSKSRLSFLKSLTDKIKVEKHVEDLIETIDDEENEALLQEIRDAIKAETLLELDIASVKFFILNYDYVRWEFSIFFERFGDINKINQTIVGLDKNDTTELGNHMYDRKSFSYVLTLIQTSLEYGSRIAETVSNLESSFSILGENVLYRLLKDWENRQRVKSYYLAALPQLIRISSRDDLGFIVERLTTVFKDHEVIDIMMNVALRHSMYSDWESRIRDFIRPMERFFEDEPPEEFQIRFDALEQLLGRSLKEDFIHDPINGMQFLGFLDHFPSLTSFHPENYSSYSFVGIKATAIIRDVVKPVLDREGVSLSLTGWEYFSSLFASKHIDLYPFRDDDSINIEPIEQIVHMIKLFRGFDEARLDHWDQLDYISRPLRGSVTYNMGTQDRYLDLFIDYAERHEVKVHDAVGELLRVRHQIRRYPGAWNDAERQHLVKRELTLMEELNALADAWGDAGHGFHDDDIVQQGKDVSMLEHAPMVEEVRQKMQEQEQEEEEMLRLLEEAIDDQGEEVVPEEGGEFGPQASVDDELGGIDFNPSRLNLRGDDGGVMPTMEFDAAMINQLRQEIGQYAPVIINIQPVKNLPLLLGFSLT